MKSLKNHYMKISAGGKFYLTMIVDVFRTSRTSNPELPIIAGSVEIKKKIFRQSCS